MPESKIVNTEDLNRGLYPSVFKKIDQSDVKVNPFLAFIRHLLLHLVVLQVVYYH
jgi:hypothetical protein